MPNTSIEYLSKRFIAISTNKAKKLYEAGYVSQAISFYSEIVATCPDNDEATFTLARMYCNAGRGEEARPLLQKISPQSQYYIEALFTLGMILVNRWDFAGGAECFLRLIELDNSHVPSHNNLALCLTELARPEDALRYFTQAIQLAPDNAETCNNLGNLFVRYWKLSEANEQYQKAIELKPDYAGAYNNLGRIACFEGRLSDAVDYFKTALDFESCFRTAADNLLITLNYSEMVTPEQVRDTHLQLASVYTGSADTYSFPRRQHAGNKIKIGYVSADFKNHSAGFFIKPVLESHNKDSFDIFCYDQTVVSDAASNSLMETGWSWRNVYGLSDKQVVTQIHADGIDILVDLSGHYEGNRLGVFALRAAPIQVTWLGYPNTTGLSQIDYRLTDEWADPTGITDHLHSERLLRLPQSFLCYSPPAITPEITLLPEEPFIFCSFNHFPKISDTTIQLWTDVLRAVPGSKLLLKNGPLCDPSVRTRLLKRFAKHQIDASRLILTGFTISREEHLQTYGKCHVALDTYPYNGTTTTCEALWMGLPVVTLVGKVHAARVGLSILKNAGLSEFIALTPDQYVKIAVALAKDPARLQQYRRNLRERLSSSPLMNAANFTSDLEQIYRRMLHQPYD
jgi:predicted O-linked N-acetylglucosamine transferase (SPINDLY family)